MQSCDGRREVGLNRRGLPAEPPGTGVVKSSRVPILDDGPDDRRRQAGRGAVPPGCRRLIHNIWMDPEQPQQTVPDAAAQAAADAEQAVADASSSRVRMVAAAATLIALVAISVPFVWQHEPHDDGEAVPAMFASHDDAAPAAAVEDGGACMANAKPAQLDFTLKDLANENVTLAKFKGKVILLNFWATWCGPCKAEIPGFVELQEQYKDDLVILGFSVDDPADKAQAFATEYKINYPVLLGLGREEVQEAYGPIWGIPTSFLIGRDGRVCKKHMGIAPKSVFEKEIQALL